MADNKWWKCPSCGQVYSKDHSYSPPQAAQKAHQAFSNAHGDITCSCGAVTPGASIKSGVYDDPVAKIAEYSGGCGCLTAVLVAVGGLFFTKAGGSVRFWILIVALVFLGFVFQAIKMKNAKR